MNRRGLAAMVILLVGSIISLPAAAAPQRSEEYVAGFAGDTDGLCRQDPANPTGMNIGVVCFTPENSRVRLEVLDATALPIAGYYVFTNAGGEAIGGAVSFCGATGQIVIPSNARSLIVYIGGPALGPAACLIEGPGDQPGIGTMGEVRATFSG